MRLKSFFLTFLVFSLQFIIFPFLLIYFNSVYHLPIFSNFFLKILGLLLITVSIMVISHCFHLFKLFGKGTPVPIEPSKKLVIQGIYKYTRNPMYIAYILIFYGEFFIIGKLLLLFYAILCMFIIYFIVVFYEEKSLLGRFGESYINYCKKVPRWLW